MNAPEYWLRGPVAGISPMLQPVAHALLQAREEVNCLMAGFPEEKLWDRPAGLASPGFHLQHISCVLDRLLTYAEGEALSSGRDRIPSTVIGLLFHAAEHTMRHTGQLLVTVRILRVENQSGNRKG